MIPVCAYADAALDRFSRLCKEHRLHEAIQQALSLQQQQGISLSRDLFYDLLQRCAKRKDLGLARQLQSLRACNLDLKRVTVLANHLIRLFSSCGSLQDANAVFHDVLQPCVYTWNAIISAQVTNGEDGVALHLLQCMQERHVEPDQVTFLSCLKACSNLKDVEQGRLLHYEIAKVGLDVNVVMASTLIDMYLKCGSLEEGQCVFDCLSDHNIVAWGALLTGYAIHGQATEVLGIFTQMQKNNIKPSKVIYLGVLKACGIRSDLDQGRSLHSQIKQCDFRLDPNIGTALIDMYSKCGSAGEAYAVFSELPYKTLVSWSAIITAFTQHGQSDVAMELFREMQHGGINPDKVLLSSVIKACGDTRSLRQGREIHDALNREGMASDEVLGSSLIHMYVKTGSLEEALNVFERLPVKEIVSWGALMAGYSEEEDGFRALQLYERFEQEGMKPDKVILMCISKACGNSETLSHGRIVHDRIVRNALDYDAPVGSNLVDMYAKCGSINEASKVFDGLKSPDLVSWGSIIAAYAQCGNYDLVRMGLNTMVQHGFQPDNVMYTTILTACSHWGLLEEGIRVFNVANWHGEAGQSIDHFNCIIDLFSRAGLLQEAEAFIATMPILPSLPGWVSHLSSCRTFGNAPLRKPLP